MKPFQKSWQAMLFVFRVYLVSLGVFIYFTSSWIPFSILVLSYFLWIPIRRIDTSIYAGSSPNKFEETEYIQKLFHSIKAKKPDQ